MACRLEVDCRKQEAARQQLQYSIRSELDGRGWGLWPYGSLSLRIHRALQDDLSQEQRMGESSVQEYKRDSR